jgi:transporter family protein
MNQQALLVTGIIFLSWGTSSFLAKIVADRLGVASIFWDIMGSLPIIVLYSLLIIKPKNLIPENKLIIPLGLLIGIIGSFGGIAFYHLLSKSNASIAIPLTALYPALTVILSVLILKEKLSLINLGGVVLSLVAIYLLSQ